ATVSVAMSGMVRSSQRVREESAWQLEMERFAAQFRTDAHQALSVQEENSNDSGKNVPTLLLALADTQVVEYRLQARMIERLLREGDSIRHRETYRLPNSFQPHWHVERGCFLPIVGLILEPESASSNRPCHFQTTRINAAVGMLQPLLAPHAS
ncbi:MAG: hypothetical protein JW829_06150, partial [Pirellulales bacterium]|nr:hypothetical protein [Pirellulales bacterium]